MTQGFGIHAPIVGPHGLVSRFGLLSKDRVNDGRVVFIVESNQHFFFGLTAGAAKRRETESEFAGGIVERQIVRAR